METTMRLSGKRAFLTLVAPAARRAVRDGLSLAWLKHAIEIACYDEARRDGLTMRQIRASLEISPSKISQVARRHRFALDAREERPLPEQIRSMLEVQPHTLAKLNQVLPGSTISQIEAAADELVDAGLASKQGEGDYARFEVLLSPARSAHDQQLVAANALRDVMVNFAEHAGESPREFKINARDVGRVVELLDELEQRVDLADHLVTVALSESRVSS